MHERIRRTIESAAAFAEASPWPSFDEMTTDVVTLMFYLWLGTAVL